MPRSSRRSRRWGSAAGAETDLSEKPYGKLVTIVSFARKVALGDTDVKQTPRKKFRFSKQR